MIEAVKAAKETGYSKADFLEKVLGINNFTEEDYAAWGTTRNELLKVITKAWFSTR